MLASSRIFAVGDIHGCLGMVESLLDKIPADPECDTLIFLGDYIDRGADSREVIEFLIGLRRTFKNLIFLMGNHEKMFRDYFTRTNRHFFNLYGDENTKNAYGKAKEFHVPSSHSDFFHSLGLIYETDQYIFVHAGLRPGIPVKKQKEVDILWIREDFFAAHCDFGKKVIFGHTPFREPLVKADKIGIDTGAVYGNILTCVQLPDEIFYFSQ